MIYSGADDWQAVHDLPVGTVLIDADRIAYQVVRYDEFPDETWLDPAGSEMAFIVRKSDGRRGPKVGSDRPAGGVLELVWTPGGETDD